MTPDDFLAERAVGRVSRECHPLLCHHQAAPGKSIGITGTVMLLSRSARFRLDPAISWPDLIGMSFVAGIGFTVALLVGDLYYGPNSTAHTYVKIGVLTGSLAAATIGAIILGIRNRHHQRQQGAH